MKNTEKLKDSKELGLEI